MTTYEQLKAKIVKHCPELMSPSDIKPGTPLRHKEGWETVATSEVDKHNGVSHENGYGPVNTFVITSKPPELRHVLLAIELSRGNQYVAQEVGRFLGFEAGNGCMYWEPNLGGRGGYDLTLPLKDQSPETLEWLNSIIQ